MHAKLFILLVVLCVASRVPCYSQPTNRTIVHAFGFPELSGTFPVGKLMEGSDGVLYGVAPEGGAEYEGVIYRVNRDGSGYKALHHFFDHRLGREPEAGLIEGSDGALYGTTRWNGNGGGGVVYRVTKDGGEYSVVHAFDRRGESAYPTAGLVEGPDGVLYGTTSVTSSNGGSIFRLNKDGSGFATLKVFSLESSSGYQPQGELVVGTDGFLYGFCWAGGAQDYGVIYRMDRQGSDYRILKHLEFSTGYYPSQLIAGSNNWLYGITMGGGAYGGGTLFKIREDGNDFTVLHHAPETTGFSGRGVLALDGSGKIYATARSSNKANGIIFSINTDGNDFTSLHQFSVATNNGVNPQSILCGQDGKLYVTTREGGFYGGGMIFSIQTDGAGFTNVWSFRERLAEDGRYPAALAEGPDGLLYTSTHEGGKGWGTLLRCKKDGSSHQVLQHFWTSANNSEWYAAGFMVASNGVIYGYGAGGEHGEPARLYRMDAGGSNYSVIQILEDQHTIGVSQGSDGNLYGIMMGPYSTNAYLYRLNRTNEAVEPIRYFREMSSSITPFQYPPFEGSDGNLYGLAYSAAPIDASVIYSVDKQGNNYSELRYFPAGSGMVAGYLIEGKERRFTATPG